MPSTPRRRARLAACRTRIAGTAASARSARVAAIPMSAPPRTHAAGRWPRADTATAPRASGRGERLGHPTAQGITVGRGDRCREERNRGGNGTPRHRCRNVEEQGRQHRGRHRRCDPHDHPRAIYGHCVPHQREDVDPWRLVVPRASIRCCALGELPAHGQEDGCIDRRACQQSGDQQHRREHEG